jgi:hypothetical protein
MMINLIGEDNDTKSNKFLKSVADFQYLGMMVKELRAGNTCYHSV